GNARPIRSFATAQAFRSYIDRLVAELHTTTPETGERDQMRAVVAFCRTMGQVPEKRGRSEFMSLTDEIGCPEVTRVDDLRHLFSSRAQAAGVNPILVQEMLGHTTLDMTKKYTHLGIDVKRAAMQQLASSAQ